MGKGNRGFKPQGIVNPLLLARLNRPAPTGPTIRERLERADRPTWDDIRRAAVRKQDINRDYLEEWENSTYQRELQAIREQKRGKLEREHLREVARNRDLANRRRSRDHDSSEADSNSRSSSDDSSSSARDKRSRRGRPVAAHSNLSDDVSDESDEIAKQPPRRQKSRRRQSSGSSENEESSENLTRHGRRDRPRSTRNHPSQTRPEQQSSPPRSLFINRRGSRGEQLSLSPKQQRLPKAASDRKADRREYMEDESRRVEYFQGGHDAPTNSHHGQRDRQHRGHHYYHKQCRGDDQSPDSGSSSCSHSKRTVDSSICDRVVKSYSQRRHRHRDKEHRDHRSPGMSKVCSKVQQSRSPSDDAKETLRSGGASHYKSATSSASKEHRKFRSNNNNNSRLYEQQELHSSDGSRGFDTCHSRNSKRRRLRHVSPDSRRRRDSFDSGRSRRSTARQPPRNAFEFHPHRLSTFMRRFNNDNSLHEDDNGHGAHQRTIV